MSSILICVPTKDRSEMLKDVLMFEAKYYKENDISLLVYDSSENDETLQVVREIKRVLLWLLNIVTKIPTFIMCGFLIMGWRNLQTSL